MVKKIVDEDSYCTRDENGKYHSDSDQPAYVHDLRSFDKRQYKAWYRHGVRHRENGPAIEKGDGKDEYWLEEKILTKEEFFRILAIKRIKKLEDHE
jgi:hypothetical protein